jgi:hypothetical protein
MYPPFLSQQKESFAAFTTLSGSAWRITSIGSFTAGAVLGFGYSAYKSITDGIDWTRDATKTVAQVQHQR